MRIQLLEPDKDKFFDTLYFRTSVCYLDEIQWLVYSDLDVSFYRVDKDRTVEISKAEMKIAVEENWEMR